MGASMNSEDYLTEQAKRAEKEIKKAEKAVEQAIKEKERDSQRLLGHHDRTIRGHMARVKAARHERNAAYARLRVLKAANRKETA